MQCEIVEFTSELLPEAAELLALRHQRCRKKQPGLPARFEQPDACRVAIEALRSREWADGVAAIKDGRLLGFLIGEMVLDELWGRSGWVRYAGCALAPDQDAELVRDLYAALGARWIKFGCYNHFAQIPPQEEALVWQWFTLCFGIEQVYALMDMERFESKPVRELPGVEIRRATTEDSEHFRTMSDVIWRVLVKGPVWSIHLPERQALHHRQYGELVDEPEGTLWIALSEGEPAGYQAYYPEETSDDNLMVPDQCAELGIAGTVERYRGAGIGTAMTQTGLSHIKAEGYRYCFTDWRSTNLLASRFWPRRGFEPVMYRLSRRIDFRNAWAGER